MSEEAPDLPARPDEPRVETSVKLDTTADHAAGTPPFMLAASMVLASGLVLFGWDTLRVTFFCGAAALLSDYAGRRLLRRQETSSRREALLVGLLVACTLPPKVGWLAAVVAAAIGILGSRLISRPTHRRLWHPVALGRVAVQILFSEQLSPALWPVLAPGYLLTGELSAAAPLPPLASWSSPPPGFGTQAWEMIRSVDVLTATVPVRTGEAPAAAIAALVRDALPPWSDTLSGVAGGAIGEACTWAILAAGLLLVWRGWARLATPLAGVFAGAMAAAVLPVALHFDGGALLNRWLPGTAIWDGLPVGATYALYHLTAGEFALVLVFLAADPSTSPLGRRSRVVFGALIGGLTVALRVFTGLPAAGYWALLIANTLVPLMNYTKRRPI